MAINLGRETFKLAPALRDQKCSCGCGQKIVKGQMVHTRKHEGRSGGYNRILDLEDHYRAWLEKAAAEYASAMAAKDRLFADYLGGRR